MVNYARLAVLAGAFSGPLAGNAVLAVVPILEVEFGFDAAAVLLSISFYMFPFAIFSFFSGSLSDIIGRRRIVTLGFLIYALGALLCAFSQDIWTFYISRSVQGFGYAFVNPVLMVILAEVVSPSTRARNMGYLAAATTTGVACGPLLAGLLSTYDWRYTFILIAILCFLCNAAILLTYRGGGFQRSGERLQAMSKNLNRAIHQRWVLLIAAIGFLNFFCYIGALAYVSDTLASAPLRLSESVIGGLIALTGLAGIFAAPLGGIMTDRLGRAQTGLIGLALVVLSLFALTQATETWTYALSLIDLGAGTQMLWAALFTLAMEIVPDIKGTVSSVFNSARFLGYAFSPLLLGPIYMASGYDAVLYLAVVLEALAIILCLGLERWKDPSPPIAR